MGIQIAQEEITKPHDWTEAEWERAQDEECRCDIPGPHKKCKGEK